MPKYIITFAKLTGVYAREAHEVRCATDDDAIILAKEKLLKIEPPARGFYVKCQRVLSYNDTKYYKRIYTATYNQVISEAFNETK